MSSAAVTSPRYCQRCSKPLVRNHGEPECLSCGEVNAPVLSVEEARAEAEAVRDGKTRRSRADYSSPAWTPSERLTWDTWKEDPVPGETGEPGPRAQAEPELKLLDTVKLAAVVMKSLRGLALEMGRLQTRQEAIRDEAKTKLHRRAMRRWGPCRGGDGVRFESRTGIEPESRHERVGSQTSGGPVCVREMRPGVRATDGSRDAPKALPGGELIAATERAFAD